MLAFCDTWTAILSLSELPCVSSKLQVCLDERDLLE